MSKATSTARRAVRKPLARKRDSFAALGRALRLAREEQQLTQADLADKLDIRQRQISDLERSAMDPRFSTVQDVARALGLEVTLIPRQLMATVERLHQRDRSAATTPMYVLDEEAADEDDDDGRGNGEAGDPDGQALGAATTRLTPAKRRRQ
jgi:transcriptional regulator with XRE-family HTH domain